MDGEEEVPARLVGDLSALRERHVDVCLAGQYHRGAGALENGLQLTRHREGDILLDEPAAAVRAVVRERPTVARIDCTPAKAEAGISARRRVK